MKFVVRVAYDADFASAKWDEGFSIGQSFVHYLDSYVVEKIGTGAISQSSFIAEDVNAKACEEHIRSVWNGIYPDNKNALDVMMVPDDGTPASEVMKVIYKNYYGWNNYQRLCTDITWIAPLFEGKKKAPLISMNYLVSIDSGCGFSTMLASFGDFLNKVNYFDEINPSYYEYVIGAESKNGKYTPSDVVDQIWDEEMFDTVIGFDIGYFLNKDKHDELREFLNRLYKLQQKYVFMFRIPALSENAIKEIKDIISDVVEVETIIIPQYNDLILMEQTYFTLSANGFDAKPSALLSFSKFVHKEKMDGRFNGFKTIDKIANEIVWAKSRQIMNAKYQGIECNLGEIEEADLADIMPVVESKLSGFDELKELIGMEDVYSRIEEITNQVMVSIKNESMDRPCIHMRFVGAPGTGKTTVARIVGKIFKEKGILKKGGFFEYEARMLCAEYVGQTAPKTHSICRDAYGSVLFIDEAYSLFSGENDKDFGSEAITTLVAEMENHRDDMVVIMAGYTDDMDKLMTGNVGLRSRMPFIIEFKNYTREQLVKIYMKMARKNFQCEDGLEEKVSEYFSKLDDSFMNSKEFANARFVRNLYERTWAKAASRVAASMTDIITLTKQDFENAAAEKEFSEKLMVAKKIGFV